MKYEHKKRGDENKMISFYSFDLYTFMENSYKFEMLINLF